MEKKIKVVHIITKLELGGAQKNTLYTVEHLDKNFFSTILISGKGGILDSEAQNLKNTKIYFVKKLIRSINPFCDLFAFFNLLIISFFGL